MSFFIRNYSNNSPCRTCKERNIGCHGNCYLYKAYRRKICNLKHKEIAERKTDADFRKMIHSATYETLY